MTWLAMRKIIANDRAVGIEAAELNLKQALSVLKEESGSDGEYTIDYDHDGDKGNRYFFMLKQVGWVDFLLNFTFEGPLSARPNNVPSGGSYYLSGDLWIPEPGLWPYLRNADNCAPYTQRSAPWEFFGFERAGYVDKTDNEIDALVEAHDAMKRYSQVSYRVDGGGEAALHNALMRQHAVSYMNTLPDAMTGSIRILGEFIDLLDYRQALIDLLAQTAE